MPYSLLPTLLLQILVVGYTPGPANIYSLAVSLRHGHREALRVWLGLLTGFCIAAFAMVVLTYLVGMAVGEYVSFLRYVGAAYLAYLAYKIYNRRGMVGERGAECSFWGGVMVQLTNAKMLLFELTVFSSFVLPYSDSLADLLEVAVWLVLAGPGGNLAWLLAGGSLRGLFAQHGRLIDVFSAIVLILCALWIVIP